MKHKVEITETLQRVIEVEASTMEDAERAALGLHRSGEVVLSADDFVSVYDDGMICGFDCAVELAMDCVVLKHISDVIRSDKVVDGYNFYVWMVKASTENESADSAETIDADFDHWCFPPKLFWSLDLFCEAF